MLSKTTFNTEITVFYVSKKSYFWQMAKAYSKTFFTVFFDRIKLIFYYEKIIFQNISFINNVF